MLQHPITGPIKNYHLLKAKAILLPILFYSYKSKVTKFIVRNSGQMIKKDPSLEWVTKVIKTEKQKKNDPPKSMARI